MNTNFFTGLGDGGNIIFNGEKKSKADSVFNVLGLCDEVNVLTGSATLVASEKIKQYTFRIQELLFIAQAEIASIIFGGGSIKIKNENTKELEEMIVWCDGKIPPIKNFVIPGGSDASVRMDIVRVRTRDFERALIGIENNYVISSELKMFANRLSSVFFAFARYENCVQGIEEKSPTYK